MALLLTFLSLGTVLRVSALPTEARTVESWYEYSSLVGFDFQAKVTPSRLYPNQVIKPEDLVRIRVPVDPPIYRRVLISSLTDTVSLSIPYSFKADREAATTATLRIDGTVSVPNLWQRSVSFVASKEINLAGLETTGVETIDVSVGELLAEMESNRTDFGIGNESLEISIRPIFEIRVSGLREPVTVLNNPDFRMTLRQNSLEIDDTATIKIEKRLSETKVVPLTISLFGMVFLFATLRNVAMTVGILILAYTMVLVWRRVRQQTPQSVLAKLGPHLVAVRHFEPPASTPVADVSSVKEMLQLQAQTDRPIMQVGSVYYLLDGTTCYRLVLDPATMAAESTAVPNSPDEMLRQTAVSMQAELVIDPFITRILVQSPQDMLQLHQTTGRTIMRTPKAYQMIDGSICYELPILPVQLEPLDGSNQNQG